MTGYTLIERKYRRHRFGHINCGAYIQHELGTYSEKLNAFPVLPAEILMDKQKEILNNLYEDLIDSRGDTDSLNIIYNKITKFLTEIIIETLLTHPDEVDLLARGAALERK